MLSLSQATSEALARTSVFEEELRRNNEVADRYEEQVKHRNNFNQFLFIHFSRNCDIFTCSKLSTSSLILQ